MSPAGTTTIPLSRGAPSLDIIDVEGLREAAVRAFANDPAGATAYGTSVGYLPLRKLIAGWHGVEESQVLITNGSMQADAFLFDEEVAAGAEVIVERPSYDRTLLGLRARGAKLHAVPLEPDGIDIDALEELLAAGAKPALAHIIPNFQNPAGYTLSLVKRKRLLELAGEHGFTIFEDDPYVSLRFRGETLPTMLSLDGGAGRVVYASSFSKTVCPGIRVGYLVGPAAVIKAIAKRGTNTYISPGMVSGAIVYEFASSGALERSIETVRAALEKRVGALASGLARELPDARFVAPDGGYFLWVELPEDVDSTKLVAAAGELGVAVVDGDDFLAEGRSGAIRLSFAPVTPEQADEATRRLAAAVASLR
ncbi:MAG: PLP-dependent aminotransferase family protein [Solirubrobacteraceae bacterium]|jgi:DNA-binding transcriptional MocR family regulator